MRSAVCVVLSLLVASSVCWLSAEADGAAEVAEFMEWLRSPATRNLGGPFPRFRAVLARYGELRVLLAKTIDCNPNARFTIFVPYPVYNDGLFTTIGPQTKPRNNLLAHFYDQRIQDATVRSVALNSRVDFSIGEAAALFRTSDVVMRTGTTQKTLTSIRTRTPARTWSPAAAIRYRDVYYPGEKPFTVHIINQRLRSNVTRDINLLDDIPNC